MPFWFPPTSYTSGWRQADEDQATALDAELALREIQTFQWADSTARGAQAGMAEGDIGYQADTNLYYKYSGSAWGLLSDALTGTVPIIPTGSTGGTVAAGGKVTFTAQTSVTIAGCFTATYDHYFFTVELTATSGAAGQVYAQLKAGAGATVTTNYSGSAYEVSAAGSGSPTAGPTSAFLIGRVNGATGSARNKFDIYSPFLAIPTLVEGSGTSGDGVVRVGQGGTNTNSTSYDSIVITLSSGGTMTGTIRCYGYTNN